MSVTTDTGVARRWQVQQPVPICTVEKCRPFEDLVYNDDGAHKAALGHTAVTGHETWVAETSVAIYARPGGPQ